MDSLFSDMFSEVNSELTTLHVGPFIPRLLAAVAIGTLLAMRPWRLLMGRPLPKAEMVQAQLLLCCAAAVMTAVVGNSVAKAFGLMSLGGFVRFRSGIKDPRDAALFFLVMGLGMACGHGNLALSVGGAGFVAVLLLVLDVINREQKPVSRQRLLVSAQADDLAGAEASLRRALGERNVLVKSCALDFAAQRVELEVEEKDPGALVAALGKTEGVPLRGLRWTELSPKGTREGLA